MFRFVVVIWSAENEAQARAAQFVASRLKAAQWDEPLRAPGMRVFQLHGRDTGLSARVLPCAAGVIIGRTFERVSNVLDDTPAPQWTATPFEAEAILASRGRWLLNRCWGNYVAILRTSASRRICVVKDPVGSLPCCVTRFGSVTVIFSFADDLVRLGLCTFTVNQAYLRARMLHGADFQRPPLNEVDQVGRGEGVEIDAETGRMCSRQLLWRPQSFTHSDDALDNPDEAAHAMRAGIRMSTHTLAALDASIVHRLSSGLGSSIIARCLADAPSRPRVCCYTRFNPTAPSDERHWLHALASQLNFEHLEVGLRPQDVQLRRALNLPLLAEPISVLGYTLRSTIEQEIATETGASIVFDGEDGDVVFGSEAVQYAAMEYVRRQGLSAEMLRIASRVALHTHQSTWSVVYRAVTASLTGTAVELAAANLPMASRLINRDVMAGDVPTASCAHPWFAEGGPSSWAIMNRLRPLFAPPSFYDVSPRESAPEVVSPLCSQPVVETMLRIPLYRLFEGGRNCGLARRAFANDVPEQLLSCSWQERTADFNDRLVHLNRSFLREILLDGSLARDGLLDRAAVEHALSDGSSRSSASSDEIMQYLDVQMWVHAWTSSLSQQRRHGRLSCLVGTTEIQL